MAPAKKMHCSAPPKRALIEPYSSPTDTPTHCLEGLAVDGSETIAPSPSQTNSMSGFETVAPSPSKTNAPSPSVGSKTVAPSLAQTNASAGTETIAPSPSETNAPSPQSRTSGVGASSSRRVWRPTVGKAIEKRIAKNNGNKLYISITATFYAFEGVLATPGSNEIGLQVRRICPIQGVSSWTVADPATNGAIVQAVRDKFEIGDDCEDNSLCQQVVEKKCYVLHKD